MLQQNPIEQLQLKFKELENRFKEWLAKQSLPVKANVVTTTSGVQGAAIGAFMGTLSNDVASSHPVAPPQAGLNPQAMAYLMQAPAQARNFAIMMGVGAVISWVMKRLRGKEDVESRQKMNSKPSDVSKPKVGRRSWRGDDAEMLVSKTEYNPRRRFRGNPNFRSGQGCEFFDSNDPAIDELRETVSEICEEISEIDSSIEVCNKELRSMRKEMKEVGDKCIKLENKLGLQTKLMFVIIVILVLILMGNVNP